MGEECVREGEWKRAIGKDIFLIYGIYAVLDQSLSREADTSHSVLRVFLRLRFTVGLAKQVKNSLSVFLLYEWCFV